MAASAFGADPVTTVYWGFDNSANPAIGQAAATNPYTFTGTAAIDVGLATGYYPGKVVIPDVDLNFGNATGVWDIGPGSVVMGLPELVDATPETTLSYSVIVRQFASTAPSVGFPYSPIVTFSTPGAQQTSQVEVEQTVNGVWIETTYNWQQLTANGPITLTMFSDGNKGLLLDSLTFSVMGDLVPIPEPSVAQLGALAALMLGLSTVRRNKVSR
jgi:hypothetical protein